MKLTFVKKPGSLKELNDNLNKFQWVQDNLYELDSWFSWRDFKRYYYPVKVKNADLAKDIRQMTNMLLAPYDSVIEMDILDASLLKDVLKDKEELLYIYMDSKKNVRV